METVTAVVEKHVRKSSSQARPRRLFFSDVVEGLVLNKSWWKHVGFIQAVNGKNDSVKMSLGFTHTPHVVHFKVASAVVAAKLVARIKKLHKRHYHDMDLEPVKPSAKEVPAIRPPGALKDFVGEQPQERDSDSDSSDSDSTVTLDF
ncbi:hypothetical protein HDU78_000767 [Chytriomyces hyalinus]|nr:hypothetical protein HDU78_000767 [Chytriomyces hyalinus]